MSDRQANRDAPASPDQILRGLAWELKGPLTYIARLAELQRMAAGSEESGKSIESVAQEALTLLDSYLLAAQTEYGQVQLPLEGVGIGAVLYDVSQALQPFAQVSGCEVKLHINRDTAVMSHAKGLRTILTCIAQFVIDQAPAGDAPHVVQLKTYRRRSGELGAGIFADYLNCTQSDIKRARRLYGRAHMAVSLRGSSPGVRLAIAENLASSIGAELAIIRSGGQRGIGLNLVTSRQLSLV